MLNHNLQAVLAELQPVVYWVTLAALGLRLLFSCASFLQSAIWVPSISSEERESPDLNSNVILIWLSWLTYILHRNLSNCILFLCLMTRPLICKGWESQHLEWCGYRSSISVDICCYLCWVSVGMRRFSLERLQKCCIVKNHLWSCEK